MDQHKAGFLFSFISTFQQNQFNSLQGNLMKTGFAHGKYILVTEYSPILGLLLKI